MHLLFGQGQLARPDILHGMEFDLLESHHLGVYLDFAMVLPRRPGRSGVEGLKNFDFGVGDGIGEVFRIHLVDVSLAIVVVEAFDVVLHTVLDIDCLLVQRGECAREIRFADYAGLTRVVHNDKVVRGDGAQADGVGRIALRDPVPAVLGVVQKAGLLEVRAEPREVERPKLLIRAQGQLEGGALQVIQQNKEIVGVHVAVLR